MSPTTINVRSRSISPPGRVAKRLLMTGICMIGAVLTIVVIDVHGVMQAGDHKLALGHDLLPSYVAGTFVRQGRPDAMYNLEAVHREEAAIVQSANLQIDGRGGPWLNPPFFAWLFAPLSVLPYRSAARVFLSCNVLLLGGSIWLLCRQLRLRDWRAVLVPLLICTAMPFWQALCHQQNTFISLFLISLVTTFWLEDKPMAAGCVAGLLFFKPQLALVVSVVLVATSGRHACLGLLVTTTTLLVVTLLTLPGTLGDYLRKLGPILKTLQTDRAYNWGRQTTFQSFWRLLCEGHVSGATRPVPVLFAAIAGFTIAALLAAATWKHLNAGSANTNSRRRLIGVAIASMPLLMPYYMDYDLLLLAVPAVLFACDWLERDSARATNVDRWQMALWIALFFETQINPGLAGQTRFNLAVPILVALWGVKIAGCLRRQPADQTLSHSHRNLEPALAA